jgi:Ca2+-binding EF-hand superfamily protein
MFQILDQDKDGSVTSDEIKTLFGNHIEDKVVSKMIKQVDSDGDGVISF